MANIRKLQENTATLVQSGCSPIRVGGYKRIRIRPSGEVKTPPLPSGVRIPDVNIRVESARQPDGIPTRICCPDALRWCIWTPCPDILLAFWILLMDSKELSSISDCFGDQKAIKTPKLNIFWLELIARVLNMPIELKCDNYYSKVFKRVNYKLWNSTFWVVINKIE